MDNREFKEDYRQFIIPKWVASNIETFKKQSIKDLEAQSKYYIELINKFFSSEKEIDILEIGCGWGGFIYALKKLGFLNIEAIDIIPECCILVREKLGINVTCINALDFFKKNSKKYDIISAFDVIGHLNKNEIVP